MRFCFHQNLFQSQFWWHSLLHFGIYFKRFLLVKETDKNVVFNSMEEKLSVSVLSIKKNYSLKVHGHNHTWNCSFILFYWINWRRDVNNIVEKKQKHQSICLVSVQYLTSHLFYCFTILILKNFYSKQVIHYFLKNNVEWILFSFLFVFKVLKIHVWCFHSITINIRVDSNCLFFL